MSNLIIFNSTHRGASHIKKGTVCQDYSLSYESEDGKVQVAIVCDGHGSDTYVRSDVGSRLAAEITLENIRDFVKTVPARMFLNKRGAVTSHPKDEEVALKNQRKDPGQMTEIERQQYQQDQDFFRQIEGLRDQDQCLTMLFGRIYMQWLQAIEKDALEHPFNEHEQTMLGAIYQKWQQDLRNGQQGIGTRIVKAYGSTLMAFVRTPLYWLAFHIGDGKLMACDAALQWTEPVPWDCRCFLNVTTSLCDGSPIGEFRYAFSGQGDFPVAVILGSDGLDDSWGDFERLANFYSQTIGIFYDLGKEKALSDLDEFLPKLSAKASQDDMSMAGIIDMELLKTGVAAYRKEREIRELVTERQKRSAELEVVKKKMEELSERIEALQKEKAENEKEKNSLLNLLNLRTTTLNDIQVRIEQVSASEREAEARLKHETEAFNIWMTENHKKFTALKDEMARLRKQALSEADRCRQEWQQQSDVYMEEESNRKVEAMHKRSVDMEPYSQQAVEALDQPREVPEIVDQSVLESKVDERTTWEPEEAGQPSVEPEKAEQLPEGQVIVEQSPEGQVMAEQMPEGEGQVIVEQLPVEQEEEAQSVTATPTEQTDATLPPADNEESSIVKDFEDEKW